MSYKTFICLPEIVATSEVRSIFERFSDTLLVASSREAALEEAFSTTPPVEILVVGIKETIDSSMLDKLPALRLLATLSGGTNHIDVPGLEARGITLVSIPGVNARSVGEHALMLLLGLSKHAIPGHAAALTGVDREGLPSLPHELAGTTFGVVGAGYTGRCLITLLRAFTGEILVTTGHACRHSDLEDVRFVPLQELFESAPRVSLHIPLTAKTRGLITQELVESMPADGIIVNCSRLEIFDGQGVVLALKRRPDIRLGIDALKLSESPFARFADQCMFSPHVAGVTQEAKHAMHVALASRIAESLQALDKRIAN